MAPRSKYSRRYAAEYFGHRKSLRLREQTAGVRKLFFQAEARFLLFTKETEPELKQKSPQKTHKNLSKQGQKPPEVGKNLTIKPFFNIIGFT
ncbi:MAG: hypothetical protein IIX33_05410 [Oscillospiraceae bacterium]|nr:hypothetical protein [Oscillospiraceae bacterium]